MQDRLRRKVVFSACACLIAGTWSSRALAQTGQARITADGYPGRSFPGRVESISKRMGRRSLSSDDPTRKTDTQVLETRILLDPGAPFFNDTEKVVVGSREPAEQWANSTWLGGYDAAAIRRLKDERDGAVFVSGSGTLVRALLAEGLVDELHLFVYPIALGAGERFWRDGTDPTRLALRTHGAYDNGVVHLAYGPIFGWNS